MAVTNAVKAAAFGAGAVVAIVGGIATAIVDCQKYDGAAQTNALIITGVSTVASMIVGVALTLSTLPVAATVVASVVLGMGISSLAKKLKAALCG
jgi:hypothetical protein